MTPSRRMRKYACWSKVRGQTRSDSTVLAAENAAEAAESWARAHANFDMDLFGETYVSVLEQRDDGLDGLEETFRVELHMVPKFVATKEGW
jgi:hypothetical protein